MELEKIVQRFEGDPTGYTAAIDRMIGALSQFMGRVSEANRPLDSFEQKVVQSTLAAHRAMDQLAEGVGRVDAALKGLPQPAQTTYQAFRNLRQESDNLRKSMLDLSGNATRAATAVDRFERLSGATPEQLANVERLNAEFAKTARLLREIGGAPQTAAVAGWIGQKPGGGGATLPAPAAMYRNMEDRFNRMASAPGATVTRNPLTGYTAAPQITEAMNEFARKNMRSSGANIDAMIDNMGLSRRLSSPGATVTRNPISGYFAAPVNTAMDSFAQKHMQSLGDQIVGGAVARAESAVDRVTRGAGRGIIGRYFSAPQSSAPDVAKYFTPEFLARADASYRKQMALMAPGTTAATQAQLKAAGLGQFAPGTTAATQAQLKAAGLIPPVPPNPPGGGGGGGGGGGNNSFFRRGAFLGLGSLAASTAGGLVSSMGLPYTGGGISTGGIAGGLIGSIVSPGVGTLLGAGVGSVLGAAVGLPFDILTKGVHGLISALEQLASVGTSVTKFAISTGMEFERLRISFETMAGSVEKGNALFKELQGLDVKSPFDLKTLSEASNILLAAGTRSEDVVGVLERLQDMAAGSSERLIHLANDLERVSLTGRITAREMRAFATVGIGIQDLADTMGITEGEVRFRMHQGELRPGNLIDTFNRLTSPGGRFFGLTNRYLQTVPGAYNQLVETGGQLAGTTAVRAFEKFGVAGHLQNLTGFLNDNSEKIMKGVLAVLERIKVVAEEVWNTFKAIGMTLAESLFGKGFESALPPIEQFRQSIQTLIETVLTFGKIFIQTFLSIATTMAKIGSTVVPELIAFAAGFVVDEKDQKTINDLGMALARMSVALEDLGVKLGKAGQEFDAFSDKVLKNVKTAQQDKEFNPLGLNWKGIIPNNDGQPFQGQGGVIRPTPALVQVVLDAMRRAKELGFQKAEFVGHGPAVEQANQLQNKLLGIQQAQVQQEGGTLSNLFSRVSPSLQALGKAAEIAGVNLETFLGKELAEKFQGLFRQLIPKTPQVAPQAERFADQLVGQLKQQGRDPLEAFQIRMGLINEAEHPAQAGADPRLDRQQARFARFQNFQELRQKMGLTGELHLPPASLRDSIEAASTIARSQVTKTGEKTEQEIEEEIKRVLEQANQFHERNLREVEKTNTVLERMEKNGQLPPVINPVR